MNELEFVLKKMVEIDNKAIGVKMNTSQSILDQEEALNQKLKELDQYLTDQFDTTSNMLHETAIAECAQNAKGIIDAADAYCEDITNQYFSVKDKLKQTIFNEIIESQ